METRWASAMRLWAEKFGIKAILFDLDDTLIKVRVMFTTHMKESVDYICSCYPEIGWEELRKRQQEINNEEYLKYSVNPDRWRSVYRRLQSEFPGIAQETWDHALNIVFRLYTDTPEVFAGVFDILSHFRKAGIRIILVTHASEEWTELKLRKTGLDSFLDTVVCISPDVFKDLNAWSRAIKIAEAAPAEVVVVGDNLPGDIISAYEVGVRHLYWVDAGVGWEHYRKGKIPEGAAIIREVGDLLSCIEEQTFL